MKEVSVPTAALLLDALERRGLAPDEVWAGLNISRASFADPRRRFDWELWVEMMARAEVACGGAEAMQRLFVPGAGGRTGHPFVQLANAFLSIHDVYALFARWGLSRALVVARGRFVPLPDGKARFSVTIDPERAGSLPTLRFIVGILRSLPTLQGLTEARVTMSNGATDHRADYEVVLPKERSLVTRAGRILRVLGGAAAALEELEAQSAEIGLKNRQLEEQVAELARTTKSLEERDEWLELALDAGKLGLWRWDSSTRTLHRSPGANRLLGLDGPEESGADRWLDRVHRDDLAEVLSAVRRALDHGEALDLQHRLVRPDGTLAWVHTVGRVVRDEKGHLTGAVGTVADITEERAIEAKLRFADRLISAGTLAAGVAHEVNNPLAYVMGNLELLEERLREDPRGSAGLESFLADMTDGLGRIRDIVRDLRAFSRPEEEHVKALDVAEVGRAALRIVASVVRHRARVEVDLDHAAPLVEANESRLGQVLVNLIINASDAMPEQRPVSENVIRVRARGEGDEVILEVIDNGAGIAPEVLPRLFDPFFTTKSVGGGMGLGLSVCQSIVTALHGRIEVDTAVGRGSTFRVVLPTSTRRTATSTIPEVGAAPSSLHVLVIDDEPLVRRSISALLERRGLTVTQADGGPAGLALALEKPFDAILCDLMMPDVTGADLHAALLRDRPELAQKVVLMTGGAVTASAREFIANAGLTVLQKPFSVQAALEAFERVASAS